MKGFKREITAIIRADVKGYSRLVGEDEDATGIENVFDGFAFSPIEGGQVVHPSHPGHGLSFQSPTSRRGGD